MFHRFDLLATTHTGSRSSKIHEAIQLQLQISVYGRARILHLKINHYRHLRLNMGSTCEQRRTFELPNILSPQNGRERTPECSH